MDNNYEKWNRLAPLGLLLIGFGASVIGDAAIAKGRGKGWFLKGTVGLILLNAGVVFFGESVKARALYETEMKSPENS